MSEPRVGVAVIVHKGGKVLMVKRKNAHGAGTWSVPGGHLDFGEDIETCARRETREETGVEIDKVRFKAITNDVFETIGKHYITLWMESEYLSGEARIAAEDEVAEIGWYAWEALPEPMFLPLDNLVRGKCYPPMEAG